MINSGLKFIVIAAVLAAQQLLASEIRSECVNGKWEEDQCVCNEGYETVLQFTKHPTYCSKQTVVVIHIKNSSPWTHRDVLDLTLPLFCLYIMGCCCAGVVYTLWQISLRFWTVEILRKVKLERLKFNKSIKIYKRVKLMDADVWDLPPFDYTVINSVIGAHVIQYKRAEVLHDYKAQDAEELNLKKGDMIKDIIELENGWWQGDLNGHIGYFPGDYVKFFDNTKKTGSAIAMNDPDWTQGIQETALTLQYQQKDGKKAKKDDEILSETSSMYMKDLTKVKEKLPKRKWLKKFGDTAAVVTKRKKKPKQDQEESLLVSSDDQSVSSEHDVEQKEQRKKKQKKSKDKRKQSTQSIPSEGEIAQKEHSEERKQKKKGEKDKQERKTTEDTIETLAEDDDFVFIDSDGQSAEVKQSKQKKKSQGKKRGKRTGENLSKQPLVDDSQISIDQEKQEDQEEQNVDEEKVKGKEKKRREQRSQKHKEKQDSKKLSLKESDIELSDEIHLKEGKEGKDSKQKRKDRRGSDKVKESAIKTTRSVEGKQKKKRKEASSESEIESDKSDDKLLSKKRRRKHKQKTTLSDEEFGEAEEPSTEKKQKGKKRRKQSDQITLSEGSDIEVREKSKGKKSKRKQPKKDSTESIAIYDEDSEEKLSVTISDIEFLTESEEEKPKQGFFKRLFRF